MTDHARLAPSSASIWVHCPGSVQMQEKYPEPEDVENIEAEEGTAAHELAYETLMAGELVVSDKYGEQMQEDVQLYVDYVRSFGLTIYPEYPVKIPDVHPTDCWGTVDLKAYSVDKNVLRVTDFKYGHGFVDEVENWQLICYASGLISEMGLTGLETQNLTVVVTIVQPRCYGYESIRSWSCKASDLRAHINILKHSADNALSDNPNCKAGSHCKHCTAKNHCKTNNDAVLTVMDDIKRLSVLDIPHDVIGKQLVELKAVETLLTSKVAALEQQVQSLLSSGTRVNGWVVKNVEGRLKWTESADTLVTKLGTKVMKIDVITPTQAKKVIDESVINQYSERPSSVKLVKDDMRKASKIFGNQGVSQ